MFEVVQHRVRPAIGAGDPSRGTGIDPTVQRLVALAHLLPNLR